MKYLKYGIGLIGACAIVSASVVAPFSYAWDISSYTEEVRDRIFDGINALATVQDSLFPSVVNLYSTCGYVGAVKNGVDYDFFFPIRNVSYSGGYWDECYYYCLDSNCYIRSKNDIWTSWRKFNLSRVETHKNGVELGEYSFSWDEITYIDLPDGYYSNSGNEGSFVSSTGHTNNSKIKGLNPFRGTVGGNIGNTITIFTPPPTTAPPYTNPAPGFPNLPNDWVNGGGDVDIKIDLPDIDFNLPDLPDYTLPSAPTIPEKFQTGISTVFGKIWDIVVQAGLVWLVVFSLTCSLIIYILSR